MTHPDATHSHERTASESGPAFGVPIEAGGMTIRVDELWTCTTAGGRALVGQIAREMRQPMALSPDPTDSCFTGDTATD